jgi:hypothetical protein
MDQDPAEEDPLPELDEAQFVIDCPICGDRIDVMEYHPHMIQVHPVAYITMMSSYMPHVPQDELLQAVANMTQFYMVDHREPWGDDEDEADTYASLLELCDEIGYVRVGLNAAQIDAVAPREAAEAGGSCPICLEESAECGNEQGMRRFAECKHAFCAPCLERWLSEHKWCPVCKKEPNTARPDQMASMSNESASDPDSPPSSSLPAPTPPNTGAEATASPSSMNTT